MKKKGEIIDNPYVVSTIVLTIVGIVSFCYWKIGLIFGVVLNIFLLGTCIDYLDNKKNDKRND